MSGTRRQRGVTRGAPEIGGWRAAAAVTLGVIALAAPGAARAEGTAQFGPDQDLVELERNYIDGTPQDGDPVTLLVDILQAGETINISVGANGVGGANRQVTVRIWRPGLDPNADAPTHTEVIQSGDPGWLDNADNPIAATLTNPFRYVADEVGEWKIRLQNGDQASAGVNRRDAVDPFDVTVTPPGYSGSVHPYAPPGGYGRLHALNWNFNANAFDNCTDLRLYILTDGGFIDTNYVWLMDAPGFCGYYFNLVANSLGLDPQSGYSLPAGATPPSSIFPQYPIYLNPPEVARPKGTTPLLLGDYRFTDSSGVDQTVSPNGTPGTQDVGAFHFTTNLETFGTYAIIIDTNHNGVFDPFGDGDVLLQDFASPGDNTIPWDGKDSFGNDVPQGLYDTQIYLRVGDFHFAGYDIEFANPGIRILDYNEPDGVTPPSPTTTPRPTFLYWDDTRLERLDNGNVPRITSPLTGPVSSGFLTDPVVAGDNAHAWGLGLDNPGEASQTSGNDALVDTAVFGNAVSVVKRGTVIIYDGGGIPGCPTCSNAADDVDLDQDGLTNDVDPDPIDADSDDDGLRDGEEVLGPDGVPNTLDETNPLDADSDDDGINDYDELFVTHTNPLLYDTDSDGIQDGTELGRTVAIPGGVSDFIHEPFLGTDVAAFRPDGDAGATVTDPLDDDVDDDGLLDGSEDLNADGVYVPHSLETDPRAADTDGDGLSDGVERGLAVPQGEDTDPAKFIADADAGLTVTDPTDTDTDEDGLLDSTEDANGDGAVPHTVGGTQTSGQGETDPGNADTDGDGIQDGTELGLTTPEGPDTDAGAFQPDADPTTVTDPLDTDTDDGGVPDGAEDLNADGAVDAAAGETDPLDPIDDDSDGDGLMDIGEALMGLDPHDADTDDDGLLDGVEALGTGPLLAFGPSDPKRYDTDGDGLPDGLEAGADCTHPDSGTACVPDADPATLTDPSDADTDDDGLADPLEDLDHDGAQGAGETDASRADSDGDGLPDGLELGTDCSFVASGPACLPDTNPGTTTDPLNADTDGDGLADGVEDANHDGATAATIGGTGTAGNGETDPANADTDGDGLGDGDEALGTGPLTGWAPTSPLDTDTDDGGIPDGAEVLVDGTDPGDPADDIPDGDLDGLKDADEAAAGTDPADADTDDDGLLDGEEVHASGRLAGLAPTDPLTPDTDGDGLTDGLERGTDCAHTDSDPAVCVPDADPAVVTDPGDADTDDDGLSDGVEDVDHDGWASAGEPDPAAWDTDGDGLSDGLERGTGCTGADTGPACVADADPATQTNPALADTDLDGLPDGVEDADGDGATSYTLGGTGSSGSGETDPAVPDTDGDGLRDGDEALGAGPVTVWGATSPLDTDTDDGGVPDGREVAVDRTDPNDPSDDALDDDGDLLSNQDEALAGTDPADADTDDDGLLDGEEVHALGRMAGLPVSDPLDPDSDGDGLLDGLERGTDCGHPDSDAAVCVADADPGVTTSPTDADTDDDGLGDAVEDADGDGAVGDAETNPAKADTDGDGLGDGLELGTDCAQAGTDPAVCVPDGDAGATTTDALDADTDDDGLLDGQEDADGDGVAAYAIGGTGTAGSGETDPNLRDTDGDGLSDGLERGVDCGHAHSDPALCRPDADGGAETTDPLDVDTDDGGLADGAEDLDGDGAVGGLETDPNDPSDDADGDGDGLSDQSEALVGTDPAVPDTDGDGLSDLDEVTGLGAAGGVTTDPLDADTDDDGLADGAEVSAGTDPTRMDTDGDGLGDGLELGVAAGLPGGTSAGGVSFAGTAAGFVGDADQGATTTDPLDDDSDDDGLTDGAEDADGALTQTVGGTGTSGSGETDPNAWDSDGDGLSDGQELGLGAPQGLGTDPGTFAPDADAGATTTDPLDTDTDDGSVADGTEDLNHNGAVDAGEGSPNDPADDLDRDQDGLSDADEAAAGTDPGDADTDDDGLADGAEAAAGASPLDADTDDDGLADGAEVGAGTDPAVFDTDGDGLGDGLELGVTSGVAAGQSDVAGLAFAGTDPDGGFVPDGDGGATVTDPLLGDTDDDGLSDGVEDRDGDGVRGSGEADPVDADSDDDGALDGAEDANGDGLWSPGETNLLAPDTDGDGLLDGTELGLGCAHADSHPAVCVADADGGATTTVPTDADSDDDGLSDGFEDADHNGTVSAGETDPGAWDTDGDGLSDGTEVGLVAPQGPGTAPAAFLADGDGGATTTDPTDADTDGGGVADGDEDADHDGVVDPGETDPLDGADDLDRDVDGLPDAQEAALGTDADDPDTDGDGILDGEEVLSGADGFVTDPLDADTDDDGVADGDEVAGSGPLAGLAATDPTAWDTDGDGLSDGLEAGLAAGVPAGTSSATAVAFSGTDEGVFAADEDGGATVTDPAAADTDGDGLTDGAEDANRDGVWGDGETDPLDADTDDDGLADGAEGATGTDPLVVDSDGDGLPDGLEVGVAALVPGGSSAPAGVAYVGTDPGGSFVADADAGATKTDPTAVDTDGDGLDDGLEDADHDGAVSPAETAPTDADTDDDGLADGAEDADHDGAVSEGETDPLAADTDGDGVQDGTETGVGVTAVGPDTDLKVFQPDLDAGATTTDPLDDDTDDDGLLDGTEDANGDGVSPARLGGTKTSPWGETDPNAADTDGDGLTDGQELGLAVPEGSGTDADAFTPDADAGATTTNPLDTDTDDGGLADGLEDLNRDGAVDPGESDPNEPSDDLALDSDGDGLPDAVEWATPGVDPAVADSDGDGLSDGEEGVEDLDGDGLANAADLDSDGDGVDDAVEAGLTGDADPTTTTDPYDDDTDDDGLLDGTEDANGDGAVDPDETNPSAFDSDGDGLSDGLESGLFRPQGTGTDGTRFAPDFDPATTTDPLDADSDDDGLSDGAEDANANGRVSDGETDPAAADSDGDGVQDGTELGVTQGVEGTDTGVFVPDADPATTTDPLDADSDGDGLADGVEDANANGAVEDGESNAADVADPPRVDATVTSPAPQPGGCAGGEAPLGGALPVALAVLLLALGTRRRRAG